MSYSGPSAFRTAVSGIARRLGLARARPGQTGPEAPRRSQTSGAVGNVASRVFSFRWDEALRDDPHMALAMRRDPYLMSLLRERQLPVAQLPGKCVTRRPDSPEHADAAQVLTQLVHRIPHLVKFRLSLSECLWYGRYANRVTWDRVVIDDVPRWGYTAWEPINGDKVQFDFDGCPVLAVSSTEQGRWPTELHKTGDRFPGLMLKTESLRSQFVISQFEIDDSDYFEGEQAGVGGGVGLRSRIYWCAWMRDRCLSWIMDSLQKTGTQGVWIFEYEMGNPQAQASAEQAMQDFKEDSCLLVPVPAMDGGSTGFNVRNIAGDTSGVESLREFITEYFERHIERLIVGQSLSASSEGHGLGGSGVAALHKDTKFQILRFDATNADETFTTDVVAPMTRYNYPHLDPADFYWESVLPQSDPATDLDGVSKAAALGVRFAEDKIRDLTGQEKPKPGETLLGGGVMPDPNAPPVVPPLPAPVPQPAAVAPVAA